MNIARVFVRRFATRSEAPVLPQPTVIFNGKKYTRTAVPQGWTASVVHYNWAVEYKHDPFFEYLCYAFPIVFGLCCYITSIVSSREAKKAWAQKKKDDEHKEHLQHDKYYDFLHPQH